MFKPFSSTKTNQVVTFLFLLFELQLIVDFLRKARVIKFKPFLVANEVSGTRTQHLSVPCIRFS